MFIEDILIFSFYFSKLCCTGHQPISVADFCSRVKRAKCLMWLCVLNMRFFLNFDLEWGWLWGCIPPLELWPWLILSFKEYLWSVVSYNFLRRDKPALRIRKLQFGWPGVRGARGPWGQGGQGVVAEHILGPQRTLLFPLNQWYVPYLKSTASQIFC